jgi:predicted RNA binding protein YcfA (HicA-like mRNA interferase family)
MSRWLPCKRREFIKRIRKLGFEGPYSGTRHQFMVYKNHRLAIPSNPEYSVPQLRMMLNEAGIILDRSVTSDEWNSLA